MRVSSAIREWIESLISASSCRTMKYSLSCSILVELWMQQRQGNRDLLTLCIHTHTHTYIQKYIYTKLLHIYMDTQNIIYQTAC